MSNQAGSAQRKYLIISYQYLPHIGPRTFRWSAIAEHWAAQGHLVDIVCACYNNAPSFEVINGVRVHRVASINPLTRQPSQKPGLPRQYVAAETPDNEAPVVQAVETSTDVSPPIPDELIARPNMVKRVIRKQRRVLGKYAGKLFRAVVVRPARTLRRSLITRPRQGGRKVARWIYRRMMWPDQDGLWILPATRKSESLLAEMDYDVVISVSWRFSSHVVAYRLNRKLRDKTWIVDVGDPFFFNDIQLLNNHFLYRQFNYWIEGRIFDLADAVSVTNEATRERYAAAFRNTADKIFVIPPLASALPNLPAVAPNGSGEKIRLVFTGSLRRQNRRPDVLLSLFRELLKTPLAEKLELHFYGDIKQCAHAFEENADLLGRGVYVHGLVEREIANEAMLQADVLVNIGNQTDYQLPSKVIDYMSTGKPVINLAAIAADSSARLFQTYPSALLLWSDRMSIAEMRDKVIEFLAHLPPPLPPETTNALTNAYTTASIAAQYEALVDWADSVHEKNHDH